MAATVAISMPLASADPAVDKDLCKNGGYQTLGFADQGQCVEAANLLAKLGLPFPPCREGETVLIPEDPSTGAPYGCISNDQEPEA